jgi:hypothetical protein
MEKRFVEYSYAVGSTAPIEGHRYEDSHVILSSDMKETVINAPKFLPFAAETYQISPNIRDYILVPVAIMTNDLPNRNGVGFPLSELTYFNPDEGCLGYESWKGKCTFVEHANSDITKSKGIILASSLRKMHGVQGNLFKVVVLTAWDRTKDPILANSILTGERRCYSMGAYCSDYRCSICGALHSKGGCEHVTLGKPRFEMVNVGHNKKLAYLEAIEISGFETSSVADPAFLSAQTSVNNLFSWGE